MNSIEKYNKKQLSLKEKSYNLLNKEHHYIKEIGSKY